MADMKKILGIILLGAGGLALVKASKQRAEETTPVGLRPVPTQPSTPPSEQPTPPSSEQPTPPPSQEPTTPPPPPTELTLPELVQNYIGYLDLYARTKEHEYLDKAQAILPKILGQSKGKWKTDVVSESLVDKLVSCYDVRREAFDPYNEVKVTDKQSGKSWALSSGVRDVVDYLMGYKYLKASFSNLGQTYHVAQQAIPVSLAEFTSNAMQLAQTVSGMPIEWILMPTYSARTGWVVDPYGPYGMGIEGWDPEWARGWLHYGYIFRFPHISWGTRHYSAIRRVGPKSYIAVARKARPYDREQLAKYLDPYSKYWLFYAIDRVKVDRHLGVTTKMRQEIKAILKDYDVHTIEGWFDRMTISGMLCYTGCRSNAPAWLKVSPAAQRLIAAALAKRKDYCDKEMLNDLLRLAQYYRL